MKDMPQKIEISPKTIIFTVLLLLSLNFLFLIKELVFSLFIAFIISGALKTPVEFLESKKLPRIVAALVIYLTFIVVIINLFALVVPPLIGEMVSLFRSLPLIIEQTMPNISGFFDFSVMSQNLPNLANEAVSIIKGIFNNAVFVTSTLFFGFYLLSEKDFIPKSLGYLLSSSDAKRISNAVEKGQERAASWFWGEIVLMTVVALITYVGLVLIGMKYAVALAVLAGLLEVVPNLGPIIATIPAALIGFSSSSILGLSNIALYFIVQQLENNIIVPMVMRRIVGIHPIVTLISLVIGGKLAGVMGVLLAVPTTIFIETVFFEWRKKAK